MTRQPSCVRPVRWPACDVPQRPRPSPAGIDSRSTECGVASATAPACAEYG